MNFIFRDRGFESTRIHHQTVTDTTRVNRKGTQKRNVILKVQVMTSVRDSCYTSIHQFDEFGG